MTIVGRSMVVANGRFVASGQKAMWWPNGEPKPIKGMSDQSTFYLRDYQDICVVWMRTRKRCMLTDPPGLGKTAQAAAASEAPVLIVCPNYLVEQWYEWLRGEDPKSLERNNDVVIPNVDGKVVMAKGDRWRKQDIITAHADWTVINQEMMQTHKELLSKLAAQDYWRTVIIDESHHFKSHKAVRSKTAVEVAKHAKFVYLLTATPIMKEPDDLFMQLRILQPDIFTSYYKFVDTFCVVESSAFGNTVKGLKKGMVSELRDMLNIVRLGRTYVDVGRELPPVIEKYVVIDLPDDVRKAYDDAVLSFRLEFGKDGEGLTIASYMEMFHTLRRIVTGAFKTEAVAQLLSDEVKKAVIFTWYQMTAESIAKRLPDAEVVTGKQDVTERRRRALQDKHVVATISALGEGIDLSDARTCIFAEENWTPGSNYQALSRVDRERIGPKADNSEPVIVYYVQCKRTVDEVIHRRSKGRAGTIKDLLRETLYL